MDFAAYINAKGAKILALAMDENVRTVYSWAHRNKISRDKWDKLIEIDSKLTWKRLLEIEAASLNAVA